MANSKRNSASLEPSESPSRADGDLVARALRKVMQRRELTREERRALQRHEKEKEERLRWRYYQAIPQKHWRRMSGRQAKVLLEQARRHGIPIGGATIDLAAVAKWIHDFFADNAQKLARLDDAGQLMLMSTALEELRSERAKLTRLERLARERMLLPRDEVHAAHGRIATILRAAGDALERQYGSGAATILREALEDAEREITYAFQDDGTEPESAPDAS